MRSSRLASARGVALLVAAGVAACTSLEGHRCATQDSCGAGGRCEPDGLCSFAAAACPSGRAYGDAAAAHAGECTPNQCGAGRPSWRDDFDAPGPAPRFSYWTDGSGTVVEQGGQLYIASIGPGGGGYKTLGTTDLRGGAVLVELAALSDDPGRVSYLEVSGSDTLDMVIQQELMPTPRLRLTINDVIVGAIDWDPQLRLWRLFESAGNVTFDASTDGRTWLPIYDGPTPFDVSAVKFAPWMSTISARGETRFESFAICAP